MSTDPFRDRLQEALGAQFILGRELGGGGMSRVFLARDAQLQRDVVVKLLAPELAQELSVERFAREIALAAALQHANIVPLLSAGVTAEGLPFYLMPYVDGESLRQRVDTSGPLPIDDVWQVLRDVGRALAWAHARGVVHRDIKPDNVMIAGGAALVTDFGIAKAMSSARESSSQAVRDGTLTRVGTSLGTPNYMAPEQGAGDPDTDHRADLYALGAMTYELLTGEPPFGNRPAHAQFVAHLAETPVNVRERRPDTPERLAALVMSCLEKDPAARPQTAQALLDGLSSPERGTSERGTSERGTPERSASNRTSSDQITSDQPRPSYAAGTTSPAPETRDKSRSRWPMLAVGAVVLIAAGAVFWFNTRDAAPAVDEGTLLAVMPFTVRDEPLRVWREGLVDVLSRSLDGAGDLRIASPSSSIAASPERADATSASAVASSLGAGLVLFGDLSAVGPDSVHLRAALFDAELGRTRADFDVQGESTRLDALADTLALRVLRELGASGTLSGARLSSMGTSSLSALKAFVDGQRLYRLGRVDSARTAFMDAVAADSTFSLAWRGIAATFIRLGRENDPEAQRALETAIRFKAGRSPRDSMLLLADSLRLAFSRRTPASNDAIASIPSLGGLFATLREATRRYPDDAELWLELGDAAFHFGEYATPPVTSALTDFERAMALDSALLVPYVHASDLAMRAGDTRRAAEYTSRLSALFDGQNRIYYALLASVLDSAPSLGRDARSKVDSLPALYTLTAMRTLAAMPDSAATVNALIARAIEQPLPVSSDAEAAALNDAIKYALTLRGRYREAMARPGELTLVTRSQLASIGASPAGDVRDEIARALRNDPMQVVATVPFLAEQRDTALLCELVDALASRAAQPEGAAVSSATAGAFEQVAQSALALARGDSSAALETLMAVPMSACGQVPCNGYQLSGLLMAAGRDADAARVLDRWLPGAYTTPLYPRGVLLRAQLAERLGDRPRAIADYRSVVARWSAGDDMLRASVQTARDALSRLNAALP